MWSIMEWVQFRISLLDPSGEEILSSKMVNHPATNPHWWAPCRFLLNIDVSDVSDVGFDHQKSKKMMFQQQLDYRQNHLGLCY